MFIDHKVSPHIIHTSSQKLISSVGVLLCEPPESRVSAALMDQVENFLFYVLCDAATSRRDQVMAFFSKVIPLSG